VEFSTPAFRDLLSEDFLVLFTLRGAFHPSATAELDSWRAFPGTWWEDVKARVVGICPDDPWVVRAWLSCHGCPGGDGGRLDVLCDASEQIVKDLGALRGCNNAWIIGAAGEVRYRESVDYDVGYDVVGLRQIICAMRTAQRARASDAERGFYVARDRRWDDGLMVDYHPLKGSARDGGGERGCQSPSGSKTSTSTEEGDDEDEEAPTTLALQRIMKELAFPLEWGVPPSTCFDAADEQSPRQDATFTVPSAEAGSLSPQQGASLDEDYGPEGDAGVVASWEGSPPEVVDGACAPVDRDDGEKAPTGDALVLPIGTAAAIHCENGGEVERGRACAVTTAPHGAGTSLFLSSLGTSSLSTGAIRGAPAPTFLASAISEDPEDIEEASEDAMLCMLKRSRSSARNAPRHCASRAPMR
jgi:alkyl hydroperoxide reductase subunit AhpC